MTRQLARRIHTAKALGLLALLPLAAGCGGESGSGGSSLGDGEPTATSALALSRANSCDDLLASIQADAREKVTIQTQQYIAQHVLEETRYGGPTRAAAGSTGMAFGGAPEAGGAASSDASSPQPASPDDYSETNVQVEGVDEADIVKTDGDHVYVLNDDELFVLRSWPPEQTSIESDLTLEGRPTEMFVADGRAVVFSSTSDPRETQDDNGCTPIGGPVGGGAVAPAACYYGGGYTKITVATLDAGEPTVARELWVEGSYRTSRRHTDQVRVVINNHGQFYAWQQPSVYEYLYPEGHTELTKDEARGRIMEWRRDAMASIDETTLDDWLPAMVERVGVEIQKLPPQCDGFYTPKPGRADYGMTQIVGFDMSDGGRMVEQTAIWGRANEVYANHQMMVLAQHDYATSYLAYRQRVDTYSDRTILHQFDLTGSGDAEYRASGPIPGRIEDQFSIDARDGVIRVAATETVRTPWWAQPEDGEWIQAETYNRMMTLEADESGRLAMLDETPKLAEGERIYSARFMGDLGYMVTFRQIDPLFAIDLSDPEAIEVLGELKIPGFSDYMHPLDENHLLTIGYHADQSGRREGLALQIFDVTDPTDPQLEHKHVFSGDQHGSSAANYDHKAFTFYDSRNWLAFPYNAYNGDWSQFRSSLEVFHVDPDQGFDKIGSIDHSGLVEGYCRDDNGNNICRTGRSMRVRRGVFIEDYVYSISYGGVRVNPVDNVNESLATVSFPQ